MDLRTIGIVVTEARADAVALDAAAALALRQGAHLDVHCVAASSAPARPAPAAVAALLGAGLAEDGAQAAALAAWVRDMLPPAVAARVATVTADLPGLGAAVARAARFCDLAVAARSHGAGRDALGPLVREALLFGTGVPLLVVPPGERDWNRPFARVALAWNDTDAALRAARATLPLLAPRARVDVVVVDPSPGAADRSDPGGALALWLARHGHRVEVSLRARSSARVADVLLRFARDRGSEALAMGGYGHAPFRAAAPGGPARTLLAEADLPLVIAPG